MEKSFTEAELIDFLSTYYTIKDGINSSIIIETKVGYDRQDTFSYSEFKLLRTMNILGEDRTVEIHLRERDIREAFKTTFEEAGYSLEYLTFNNRLYYVNEGYIFPTKSCPKAAFEGVTIRIKPNEKGKKL